MRRQTIVQPARAGSQPGERVRPIRRVDKLNYSNRMNAVAGGRAGGRHCWTKRACRRLTGCGNSVDDDGVPAGVQSWLPLRVSQTVRVLMRCRAGKEGQVSESIDPVPSRPGRSPGAVARLPITPIDGRNWTAAMLTDFISVCTASTSTWRRNVTRLSELRCVTLVTQFVSRCNHSSIHWQSFTVNSSHHW